MKRGKTMKKHDNFLFIEKTNDVYIISMTPELQDDVGTVGFVEFADTNLLEKGEAILNLEASKTVLEIESPLSGKIIERHEALLTEPSLLNSAKSEENWIVKLSDVDEAEFDILEDA